MLKTSLKYPYTFKNTILFILQSAACLLCAAAQVLLCVRVYDTYGRYRIHVSYVCTTPALSASDCKLQVEDRPAACRLFMF